MIVLERRQALLFRSVLRRCLEGSPSLSDSIPLSIRQGKKGLELCATHDAFSVLYTQSEPRTKALLTVPASVLRYFEGKSSDTVELEPGAAEKGRACWSEQGTAKEIEFSTLDPDQVRPLPTMPTEFCTVVGHFPAAFHEVCLTSARTATKYAMNRVLVKGKTGEIVGTDSKQLLAWGGFQFPFNEDLLLPRSAVFGLQPFHNTEVVEMGRTDTQVVVAIGPWHFFWTIDRGGRFPDITGLVRPVIGATRFHLDPVDAESFLRVLEPRLPKSRATELKVLLQVQPAPVIHVETAGEIRTVALPHSSVLGSDVQIVLNLETFLRMLELKFQDFEILASDKPLVARCGARVYLMMPFPVSALSPPPAPARAPRLEAEARFTEEIPHAAYDPDPVEVGSRFQPETIHGGDVFHEARELKDSVLRAAEHAGRLVRVLWQVWKQPSVVQSVQRSLKMLADRCTSEES